MTPGRAACVAGLVNLRMPLASLHLKRRNAAWGRSSFPPRLTIQLRGARTNVRLESSLRRILIRVIFRA